MSGTTARNPILIVDDNKSNRLLASAFLDCADIQHEEAGEGVTALSLIRENEYAAILLDLEMPGPDGAETAALIRTLPAPGCNTPIIMLTAHDRRAVMERLGDVAIEGFVEKPINPQALFEALAPFTQLKAGVA